MPKTLWNEGRVVGYSAYEIYVRHAMSVDPDHTPVDEKTWLASMMGMGNAMVLHIGTDNIRGLHYRDFPLPDNSRLCAASTIVASLFFGKGKNGNSDFEKTESGWTTAISDYGILINNTSSSSPNGNVTASSSIPPKSISGVSLDLYNNSIDEYSKIVDGIAIQPGNWDSNTTPPPEKLVNPNMTYVPTLRIAFSDSVNHPFYVVFIGFLNRSIISSISDFTQSSSNAEDGDFLGPSKFPWSSKIIFSTPTAYMSIYNATDYIRSFPAKSNQKQLSTDSIIDTESTDPLQYYTKNDENSIVDIDVQKLKTQKDGASILATYSKSDNFPPALYGMRILSSISTTKKPYLQSEKAPVYGMVFMDTKSVSPINYNMADSDWDKLKLVSNHKADFGYTISKEKLKSIWSELCKPEYTNSYAKCMFYTNIQDNCAFMLFPASAIETFDQYIKLINDPDSEFADYTLQVDSKRLIQGSTYYNIIIKSLTGLDSKILYVTLGVSSSDIAYPNAMCPIDTVAPGTVKLYQMDDESDQTARLLESMYPGTTALIRDSDYVVNQLNQYNDTIPVAKISTTSIFNDLCAYDFAVNPYMIVDGNNPRDGVKINKLDGYDNTKSIWENTSSTYSITYNGTTKTGDYIKSHPEEKLQYNEPVIIVRKRIIGYLSESVKNKCGYEIDKSTGKLISGTSGWWNNAIITDIPDPDNLDKYYYVLPSTKSNHSRSQDTFAWPVRKSDHYVDVTIQYRIRLFSTMNTESGVITSELPLPSFSNSDVLPGNTSHTMGALLGSAWNYGTSSDGMTYDHGWAYIHTDGQAHPMLNSSIPKINGQQSCKYQGNTMLPIYTLYDSMTAKDVFGESFLTKYGVLNTYQDMPLHKFLLTAVTTDLGTGKTLNIEDTTQRENLVQTITFYTNGKHEETGVFVNSGDPLFTLENKLSSENVDKTIVLQLPEMYQNNNPTSPQKSVIQTGNKQAHILTLSDSNNTPYGLYGHSGVVSSAAFGAFTWMDMMNALSSDKTIDLLNDTIRQLLTAISNSSDGEWRIKIENGKITLVQ